MWARLLETIKETEVGNVLATVLSRVLKGAVPTSGHPEQLIAILGDGTRIIFRKDFGSHAHPLRGSFQGAGAIDHYNIEIQIPGANGHIKIFENIHIVPNKDGNYIWWTKNGEIKK